MKPAGTHTSNSLSPKRLWSRIQGHSHALIILLILANLVVAAFVFDDYGESWDEPNIHLYAASTQQAYLAGLRGEPVAEDELGPFNLRYYGPFYFVFSDLFARSLGVVLPQVNFVDLWHLSYFLSFLLAVVCVYALCLRWASRGAAFAAALLFNLQPLLWGHAFMNPKDIPFMAFFLLSVVLGLRAVDAAEARGPRSWRAILLAGVALGVATAMRVSAPAVGLIVAIEMLARGGRRALGPLAAYAAAAAAVAYLLWPFLWGAPLEHYFAVFNEMRDFPMDIPVRFNGAIYHSMDLPPDYLPRLMLLQLTGPLLALIAAGAAVAGWRIYRRVFPQARLLALLLGWFLVPVALVVLSQPTMYDNFRQFLFLLPPLFILAALAFDELFVRLRPALAWALVAAAVAPGLLAMVALHPYEYIFYNRLAGDPATLAQRFETEYWVTSYREAIEYLNEVAVPNANVLVFGEGGPAVMVRHFGRPDLTATADPRGGPGFYDYAILTTRMGSDRSFYPGAPAIFQVEKDGMIFVVVKDLQ
ncbi:MAG: glycosyltransferase family 39 protein [Anaerolineales bacterium]